MTKFMKVLAFALLAPVVSFNVIAGQTNSESPKFTLAISTDKPEVTLGSDIAITIKITNISDAPLTSSFGYHGRMPEGYQFEMRDEQGATVAKFGPRYSNSPTGTYSSFRAAPREA